MIPTIVDTIEQLTRDITPPSEAWRSKARARLDTLTKPLGSLGRLEDLAAQVVAIREDKFAIRSGPIGKSVYVFAADHGITAEGVSAYPREVTHQMVLNFLAGGAAVNVLARLHGVELHVVDVGVDADFKGVAGLHHHKVANGTRSMLQEAAMDDGQMAQAISVGAKLASEAAAAGQSLVAIGEMGIGNTTSASAITCALTGASPELATGRGTGLDSVAHKRKIRVVGEVLAMHFPDPSRPLRPLEILRCVGGFEIAAMAGMVLAASSHKLAVVVDGFISMAAAALAVAIEPNTLGYLIAGHRSHEPGHALLLERLNLKPVLTLDMRLGEGTGAVLAMSIVESAICLYSQMASFTSAGVSEASE
ncbi:MAG TPA: nicotinate-nucleotide--dimethylbenzimidazole phosphoribosyltransferase [Edaphobacter sp.]|nr:nicotinate-nucleotide--dimethylbenzimidazole phosphoribosyltransferase [Edaphobacter sp.]